MVLAACKPAGQESVSRGWAPEAVAITEHAAAIPAALDRLQADNQQLLQPLEVTLNNQQDVWQPILTAFVLGTLGVPNSHAQESGLSVFYANLGLGRRLEIERAETGNRQPATGYESRVTRPACGGRCWPVSPGNRVFAGNSPLHAT